VFSLKVKRHIYRRLAEKNSNLLKADDAIRTRDIGLGKTTLYRLSYIRIIPTTGHPPQYPQIMGLLRAKAMAHSGHTGVNESRN
jgi:hypothetical protein